MKPPSVESASSAGCRLDALLKYFDSLLFGKKMAC